MIGQTIAHYRITAKLGEGGMGEVYRARDTKLDRDVAIKVLPSAVAQDPERLARFEREAKVLAALNHPNIAQIHGVEQGALVMELVEGESPNGPMPFDDARKIGLQIAEALEYAHERGVMHRDLKPSNIKVTPEGTVKLLDFGLAKAIEDPAPTGDDPSNSPTLTLGGTRVGMILGTAAYMSPEQAGGKAADRRADIWSFGAVLYEMLAGKKAFTGESASDTLASVLKLDPDWNALPAEMPASIKNLVRRCLTKDRKQRLQAIGEARITLEALGGAYGESPAQAASLPNKGSRMAWVAAAMLLVSSAALGFVAWKHFREEPPHLVKLSLPPPEKGNFRLGGPTIAVSPDGRRVAFEAVAGGTRGLWVRDLDNPTPRMLAELGNNILPFWAPDSRRLGFFDGSKLKKIDVTGGPAVTIADPGKTSGSGSWNRNEVIIFGVAQLGFPLFRVSAAGGSPAPLTQLDKTRGETVHYAPWFLPDGRHFLYYTGSTDPEKSGVYVGDLASTTQKQVLAFGTRAIYANPGYLLFVRDRTLMAQPFDAGRLETTRDAVPVAEQVATQTVQDRTLGDFSASQNGVLIYKSDGGNGNFQLAWFDRTGKKLDTAGAPGDLSWFSLSPDGATVALSRRDPQTGRDDLWTRDLAHSSESRLTFTGDNNFPTWSADGTHIFFRSLRDGAWKLYQKAANGTGPEQVLDGNRIPIDASRDGRCLLTVTPGSKSDNSIWVLPLSGDRKPFPYLQSEFSELWPMLSPDGRWLAYMSNESKRMEVYVVSFAKPGGKWQISTNGGTDPVWSRDGRELYYYSADGKIMAAEIKPGPQFQFGVPKALFEVRIASNNVSFDVSKDGHFLLPALVEQEASTPMTVMLNWPELLKKK